MSLGRRYWFHGFVDAYCHRALGIREFVGYRLKESWRIMGYQDGSRLLEIARDQLSSTWCVSLEFVEFRECFVVS